MSSKKSKKDIPRSFSELTISDLLSSFTNIKLTHFVSFLIIIASVLLYNKFSTTKLSLNFPNTNLLTNAPCPKTSEPKYKYKIYGRNSESGHLKHVYAVLDRLGYVRDHNPNSTDWDLLWAHDYPFRALYPELSNLKSHQRVNHYPGCGYITNKVDLSTTRLKYILPAFKLPEQKEELIEYAKKHPSKVFVQKSNDHRNIKIEKIDSIDLKKSGTFIQEYVDKPFLVDGYKFDIGVYTIITSIDPLRVYIYNGEVLFRYCMHKYYPFDAEDLDKYVVGDDYLPTWEVPSLKHLYTNLEFSMRDSFDAYVRSQGKDPEPMWAKIEDTLRTVIINKEAAILNVAQRFKSTQNFFEMMRFDFVIDENLEVYLMEANMSPNLSSAHYPPNQLLYEQVLANLFSLVGLGIRPHCCKENQDELSVTSLKSLSVYPQECASELCHDSCIATECQLCSHCLSKETKRNLAKAYTEHVNRKDCKRIFPPTMVREKSVTEAVMEQQLDQYSPENQLQYRWFLGKCLLDKSWC